jgi:hypothetical protein
MRVALLVPLLVTASVFARSASGAGVNGAQDAKRFIALAYKLDAADLKWRRVAITRLGNELDRCRPVKWPSLETEIYYNKARDHFANFVTAQLETNDFQTFARGLTAVHSQNSKLQQIARSASVIAVEHRKMLKVRFSICDYLGRWKATKWTPSFFYTYGRGICRAVHFDADRVRAAVRAAAVTSQDLGPLGVGDVERGHLAVVVDSPYRFLC